MALKKLKPDEHFGEILVHTFWAMVMLGATTALQFIFDLILSNTFGAHGAGTFYLAFSVLLILALIGRLGFDQAVIRFIPPLLGKDNAAAMGVVRSSAAMSVALTLPFSIGLYFAASWLANDIFHTAELAQYLRMFAIAIPAFALSYIFSGVLRALKHTRAALSIERAGMYFFGIVAALTLGMMYGLPGLVTGFTIGIFLTAIIGAWFIYKYMPRGKTKKAFSKRVLLYTSIPLLFVAFAAQLNGQASLLILGSLSTTSAAGIFNAALKISMLMWLILSAINAIAATKVSELYAANKKAELGKMIAKISGLGTVMGLPLFIVIAVLSTFLLSLFGKEFTEGWLTLIVLAAGQLVNVSVGSTNYILAMTGHEKALAVSIGTALVLNIIFSFLLIPHYGILGAGISTALANVVSNVMMVLAVKKYLGVWSLPFASLKHWSRL